MATLVADRSAEYPVPTDHGTGEWSWRHDEDARNETGRCANCHAQPSCRECHLDGRNPVIEDLPPPRPGGAAGVVLLAQASIVHPIGFRIGHGPQASASQQTCEGCHSMESFCLNCHAGPTGPSYHIANFRERHGALAYGYETECLSCHNTEVFCRSCHAGQGLASNGQIDVAFHTAQPFWLLGHGQAARQRLESCTTCHAQTDCVQCHSAVSGWRVNPHGPSYDPARAADRNNLTCLRCHQTVPERP
jgi:hypothetical protein